MSPPTRYSTIYDQRNLRESTFLLFALVIFSLAASAMGAHSKSAVSHVTHGVPVKIAAAQQSAQSFGHFTSRHLFREALHHLKLL